jgi:GT2 family glycosyltransferase
VYLTDCFIGTAHAVRRDLFLRLGGYRSDLFHQGEERDYCVRMLDAGHVVRLGRADPIHHFESPKRDTRRMDLYGRRNDVLFAWRNVPWPSLPVHLLATTLNGLKAGVRVRRPARMVHGLWMGYAEIARQRFRRSPVSVATYRLTRQLLRGPVLLDEIEPYLPTVAGDGMQTTTAAATGNTSI